MTRKRLNTNENRFHDRWVIMHYSTHVPRLLEGEKGGEKINYLKNNGQKISKYIKIYVSQI